MLRHICGLFLMGMASSVFAAAADEISFNGKIRPLLAEKCLACHGPDTGSRKADLRLDTEDGVTARGVIVPGEADESEIIARILSDNPEIVMPPPDSNKRLSNNDKQLLVRWVQQGAKYEKHWSFITPKRPPVPSVETESWVRNPIDRFVLAKLKELGLEPTETADRATLGRRASLDLIGLPPTDEQLLAFLSDKSDVAFANYVEKLFKSPHFGEHRARYWLDAARYGDTHGMHVDNYREIWPYRDWVIQAFNDNMPFDQFVFEQIAGDLMNDATLDQRIATGFSRCNITTSEGGAIPEELDVRYMVDRVETTATVLLGLTAGCAVCHDHKYDPISQREFYELGAFFNNTTQPAMDGNRKDTPPVVVLPKEEFEEEWHQLQQTRGALWLELEEWKTATANWWTHPRQRTVHPVNDDKLLLFLPMTEESTGPALPEKASWADKHPRGRRGIRFTEKSNLEKDFLQLHSDQPLTISFWFRTPDMLVGTTVFKQTTNNDDKKPVGWKITTNTGNALTFDMNDGKGNRIHGDLPDNEALRPREWQHVCVRYSGGQSNSSISIFNAGKAISLRNSSENRCEAVALANVPLKVASDLPTGGLSDVRIYGRWITDEEVQLLSQEPVLFELLESDQDWDDLGTQQQELLSSFYRQNFDSNYRDRSRHYADTTQRRDYIYSRSTTTLVMEERPEKPRAWVLERGEYTQRRDEVAPGVPSVLPAMPEDAPRNRLGLARWLIDPQNPLVARVMINRMWQSIFGVGLVKTSEDFGTMGTSPSHPELLDWLAVEFVESGWDVKHMVKLMLTSAAYQQSGAVVADRLAVDPDNRYLSRGPRHRLDAELLRDQALDVSGLLRRDIGGPSVKPYQPGGLWNVVAITGSNTRNFKRDEGDALYRRSLYTFWKRTAPPPSMAAFNAPTREQCTVRRERTNTPLQALVMMNDVQFVEAAKALATKVISNSRDDAKRAESMLWSVLRRLADSEEINDVAATADSFREIFKEVPDEAKQLLAEGDTPAKDGLDEIELAAWTMVANTLMNRDDFVNK